MNERIRELVRESNLDVYGLGKERYRWEYTVEKFTELIVRECVGVVEGGHFLHDQAPTALFAKECSGEIKKHFGVEE